VIDQGGQAGGLQSRPQRRLAMPSTPRNPAADPAGQPPEQQALQAALARLLAPVAQLAVSRGLPFAAVEEMLKLAFVQAADAAHPDLLAHRKVSRITTATGINRREVTRLTQQAPRTAVHSRSLANEVYAHWLSDPAYRDPQGQPLVLPRQGPAPSFETLAQAITRDVHPRSLLDELVRLTFAHTDVSADTVTAAASAVPQGDRARMLDLLGGNVGDHLQAAVDNVVDGSPKHFEQALFADGLSDETLAWLREVVRAQWQAVRLAVVPELETRLQADALAADVPTRRWRLGLYSYDQPALGPAPADPPAPDTAPQRPRTRKTLK
jgi:hypothetical protein